MQDEYLAFYDTGHPDCREYVSAAVNAEFQRRFILRAQKGHFEESFLSAIDQLWGSQRLPDDAAVNHELLTRIIEITVRRDLRQDEVFLKSSRDAVEQFRLFDRAIKVLRTNLEKTSIAISPSVDPIRPTSPISQRTPCANTVSPQPYPSPPQIVHEA